MSGWGLGDFRRGGVAAICAAAALAAFHAEHGRLRKSAHSRRRNPWRRRRSPPGTGSPGASIVTPNPLAPAPFAQAEPVVPAGRVALAVAARYGRDAPLIGGGLIWRVYAAKPDATGMFPSDQRGTHGGADLCAAAGQLRRACQPRAGERRQGGPTARRNRARSVRNSRRRHAARGPRRRRAHPDRANIVRNLHRQPVRHRRAPAASRRT